MIVSFINQKIVKFIPKNILLIGIYRFINVLLNFLIVPLTINYVKPDQYGIWLVLVSIVSWFSIFDVGLGNGLRNNLTKSIASNDYQMARKYISTTYILLMVFSLIMFVLLGVISYFLDWSAILKINYVKNEYSLFSVVVCLLAGFCIRFFVQLISTILYAIHHPQKSELINSLGSFISLLIIFIFKYFVAAQLIYLVFAITYPPIIVMLIYSFWFFNSTQFSNLKPSFDHFSKSCIKEMLNLGFKFFILQISVLVTFTISDFLILRYLDSTEVTKYNISYRYFSILTVVSSIAFAPLWSSFTNAYHLNDIPWIKKTIKKMTFIFLALLMVGLMMLSFSNWFYKFWTGINLNIPFNLSLWLYLFMLVSVWNGIFVSFINGVGKIMIQVYLCIVPILLTIPLSYFFINVLHFGVAGMAFSMFLFNLISSVVLTYQTYLIVYKKDKGIWSR